MLCGHGWGHREASDRGRCWTSAAGTSQISCPALLGTRLCPPLPAAVPAGFAGLQSTEHCTARLLVRGWGTPGAGRGVRKVWDPFPWARNATEQEVVLHTSLCTDPTLHECISPPRVDGDRGNASPAPNRAGGFPPYPSLVHLHVHLSVSPTFATSGLTEAEKVWDKGGRVWRFPQKGLKDLARAVQELGGCWMC